MTNTVDEMCCIINLGLEPGLICNLANSNHPPRTRHLDMALSYADLCCCHTALLLQRFASTPTPTPTPSLLVQSLNMPQQ